MALQIFIPLLDSIKQKILLQNISLFIPKKAFKIHLEVLKGLLFKLFLVSQLFLATLFRQFELRNLTLISILNLTSLPHKSSHPLDGARNYCCHNIKVLLASRCAPPNVSAWKLCIEFGKKMIE